MLFLGFCTGRIDAEIPDVGVDVFAGHFYEGVFARFEALVYGVAEDAARGSPRLEVDVVGFVGLLAGDSDADVLDHTVAAFDLDAKEPEARLAVIGWRHEEYGLRGEE